MLNALEPQSGSGMDAYRHWVQDTAAARRVSRKSGLGGACMECGGWDGMMPVTREYARAMLDAGDDALYRSPDWTHVLFTPCPVCNPRDAVRDGYESLTETQVREWIGRMW